MPILLQVMLAQVLKILKALRSKFDNDIHSENLDGKRNQFRVNERTSIHAKLQEILMNLSLDHVVKMGWEGRAEKSLTEFGFDVEVEYILC